MALNNLGDDVLQEFNAGVKQFMDTLMQIIRLMQESKHHKLETQDRKSTRLNSSHRL